MNLKNKLLFKNEVVYIFYAQPMVSFEAEREIRQKNYKKIARRRKNKFINYSN
jgi:hypothetical protein